MVRGSVLADGATGGWTVGVFIGGSRREKSPMHEASAS